MQLKVCLERVGLCGTDLSHVERASKVGCQNECSQVRAFREIFAALAEACPFRPILYRYTHCTAQRSEH